LRVVGHKIMENQISKPEDFKEKGFWHKHAVLGALFFLFLLAGVAFALYQGPLSNDALRCKALGTKCDSGEINNHNQSSNNTQPSCIEGAEDCQDTIKDDGSNIAVVRFQGGLCVNFEDCKLEIRIDSSGKLLTDGATYGTLTSAELNGLKKAIADTDFAKVRTLSFTGVCPTAYDGSEVIFSFNTGSKTEVLSACEYDIDETYGAFGYVNRLIEKYYYQK